LSHATPDLLNADLPVRPIGDFIRNTCIRAALAVLIPALGKIQIAGHNATEWILEVIVRVKKMLTNHTIVRFACFAAPLTLHAGGIFSLLGMRGGVQNANGAFAVLAVNDQANKNLVNTRMIPGKKRQKLLESPNRHTARKCNRLYGFTFQIRHQTRHILL